MVKWDYWKIFLSPNEVMKIVSESIGTLFLFGGFLYGTYNLFRYKFTGIDQNLIIIFQQSFL